ncbi:PadR family transcriptional regulator [Candidatus Bathyarchaeota archaeon]|nr:PadR family transcriptional regulator [Candidatus Bathyarchaeota archaeon]
MKRSVGVPRGFLSYGVLKILNQKAMSGSEIMGEIKKLTGWKPSPGSVYLLLARLHEEGFVEEIMSDETCLKRFRLSKSGQVLLAEYDDKKEVFQKKMHCMKRFEHMLHRELDEDLFQQSTKLLESLERINSLIKKGGAEKVKEKVRLILTRASAEIEELTESYGNTVKGR